jgi:ATP-dependent RNA helicase DDX10/DBP4
MVSSSRSEGARARSTERGRGKGGSASAKPSKKDRPLSLSKREAAEGQQLQKRIDAEVPERGSVSTSSDLFADLPLSRTTQTALSTNSWTKLTDIQRASIPHALAGRDILGAAKTGSGKTLAFLVPLVEKLFRARWSEGDGVGAIVITPTRELALQIMKVLKVLAGKHFGLTAAMLCGGKDVRSEQAILARLCIIVATPGRLLQHLEQSPDLDVSNTMVLVLDEADQLLDMGFHKSLSAIISYLPTAPTRQTMLFSATQTKDVARLAQLSLSDPEYVSVHDTAAEATPRRLVQAYVVCPLKDKLNLLWSFVKAHLRHRCIVFVSSTKQARFIFEVFRRLRPGVPVMELHGKIKQEKRSVIYDEFLKKKAAVLFATDVAARGLDFPGIDWVLQLDCPESTDTYIHRVGRTARFRQRGNGLLVLLPSEAEAMVTLLTAARIPLKKISIAPSQARNITGLVSSEVAADAHLRYLAERALVSYMRSVILQPNREVFDPAAMDLEDLATSYGLPHPPKSKVLEGAHSREESSKQRNRNFKLERLKEAIRRKKEQPTGDTEGGDDGEEYDDAMLVGPSDEDDDMDDDEVDDDEVDDDDDDDESVLLRPKAARAEMGPALTEEDLLEGVHSAALYPLQRERIRRITRETLAGRGVGKKRSMEELAREMGAVPSASSGLSAGELEEHARRVAARVRASDAADRERDRLRVRAKHREERLRARGREPGDSDDDGGGVELAMDERPVKRGREEEEEEEEEPEEEEDLETQALAVLAKRTKYA